MRVPEAGTDAQNIADDRYLHVGLVVRDAVRRIADQHAGNKLIAGYPQLIVDNTGRRWE